MTKRIAVIGAGPSGLAQLRAFQSAEAGGAEIPEIVCFETQDDWGGLWNYSWRTGLDQHGEPVHCSMYRYLWSNGPKEGLEFADYTFEEHFGRNIGSYPPRAVLWDYIKGRVEKAGVRGWIRFRNPVRRVERNSGGSFRVIAQDIGMTAKPMKSSIMWLWHRGTSRSRTFRNFRDLTPSTAAFCTLMIFATRVSSKIRTCC